MPESFYMESNPHSRKYYPIWERLKKEKQVSIAVPRPLHARVIKAVIKEKWMDVGYKIQIQPKKATLSYVRKASTITFFLSHSISIDDF
jgi:hypothetical protein